MDYENRIRKHVGVQAAFDAAVVSRMPGLRNGPADAYRHILGAAELTRRYGEARAWVMLEANEVVGTVQGQAREEAAMDRHNNKLGIEFGKTSRTWEENVDKARMIIGASVAHDGSGEGGSAKWLDPSKWKSPGGGDNWPPDWSRVGPAGKDYPYGGEEHRYGGKRRGDAADDPMDRSIDTWTDEDVTKVMRSNAYWSSGYPEQRSMHEKVRAWHVRTYDRPGGGGRSGGGGGPVHVSAHVRAGAQVSDYSRARPSL